MEISVKKIRFDKSGYYFIALLALAVAGFWKSYFFKFFTGKNDFNFYFHFHALMMVIWVAILIIQPLLIRKKKVHMHSIIGKLTYVLMPVMLVSVLLVMHSGMKAVPVNELTFSSILFPVRDFFILAAAFSIGVFYKHQVQIHARAMIITGIVFIEPALFRLLGALGPIGGVAGMLLILALPITLMVLERKQKSGRWLFPAFLIIDVIVYLLLIFQVPLSFLDPAVKWFANIPLT